MSRRTLEPELGQVENLQLRVHSGTATLGQSRRRPGRRRTVHALQLPPPPPVDPPTTGSEQSAPADVDELWVEYRATPTRPVRDRLLLHYAPLVRSVAHRVAAGLPSYVEIADLVQIGFFGLIAAIERFDPERGLRFENYAVQRIRGAILDELRAQDWVPRTVRVRLRDRERAREKLESQLGRAATDEELAAELGITVTELRAQRQPVQVVSVEALDEQGSGIADLVAAESADPGELVDAQETVAMLRRAVLRLEERDRTVISLYYDENRTLADIGRTLGLTESRVCQLHSRAVVRLRGKFDELAG
ncbi:RNA polymerase, sigma 28 subunit, SigD/FliA/WhiG [Pseudonocardia thermophila]|uniref:RNA polymerase sigma factor n=1 Tax=Pseudonocardia thermophila TaxID=1848 RepID=A0A1M6ZEI7_PSETH|nr:FliA/WhiG family RNA polymerase sigma factor [Pseudonocardia thermophila]SHL28779.1 RNA polymerase, sigma 28 subunit, SigD/FliA/WhiG [Pseudonocardia thermophila]